MEDTVILKHHYIYSFRWDAKKNTNTQEFMINTFIKFNIINWIGQHEIGENTAKPHYQMAVWTEHKLEADILDKVRKRFSRSKLTHKTKGNPCSFVSGRKIKSLVAYVNKGDEEAIVNLPDHSLDNIPKWKNKNAEKIIFQDKLKEFLTNKREEYLQENICPNDIKQIIDSIAMFHIDEDINPPSRQRMLYYLVKYNFIGISDYRSETYNYRMFRDDNNYNNYC